MTEIERRITKGELSPGARLPPVRAAAAELGLAPNTVATAYRQLQDRGLVFGDGRRGTFVSDRPTTARSSDQPVAAGLVDLTTGNPDHSLLPPLEPVLRAVSADHINYGHTQIDADLAAVMAADIEPDLRRVGVDRVEAGETMAIVGGALDGMERTLNAHLRPGDRVAIEDPAYTSVLDLLTAMNLRPVPMALDEYGVLPAELERALVDNAAAVIITPRAQNPTGAAFDQDRSNALSDILGRHPDTLVIEDDHAGPVAGRPYYGTVPETTVHWVVIRSVAKSLGPDLRLACLVGDSTTVGRVIDRQLLGTGWVSHILQRTVAALLLSPSITETLEVASATYTARREHFVALLESAGLPVVGRSGLNVWVPVADEAEVVAGMQQRGFAVRSGARFRQSAGPAIRVSTASSEIEILGDAAAALIEVVGGGARTRSV
ncbi:MAG: aminotransferase class I/II-fold pyridoxal phosphate-dependent enzyme [Acidimicrobiales bacterium]